MLQLSPISGDVEKFLVFFLKTKIVGRLLFWLEIDKVKKLGPAFVLSSLQV